MGVLPVNLRKQSVCSWDPDRPRRLSEQRFQAVNFDKRGMGRVVAVRAVKLRYGRVRTSDLLPASRPVAQLGTDAADHDRLPALMAAVPAQPIKVERAELQLTANTSV